MVSKFMDKNREILCKFAEYGARAVDSFSAQLFVTYHTKKPEVPLRRHYSTDLKQRVIYQAFTLGKKSTEIAVDLDMPVRVVQRVKQTWMQIGRVCHSREFIGRHPLLSPEQTKVYFLQIHSKFMSVTIFAFHRSCWP